MTAAPRLLVAVAMLAAVFGLAPTAAAAGADASAQYVVRVTDPAVAAAIGRVVTTVAPDTFLLDVPGGRAPSGDGVVWAAPDTRYTTDRIPDDPCWLVCPVATDGQPELRALNATSAWDVTIGSPSVTVAVLDTLADVSHPELAGKVTAGRDFILEPCGRVTDEAGHGTAVAGLIGGRTGNGEGLASLGWETRVLSVGVLDTCGSGPASAVAAGVRYAVDRGARIVNLSLSGDGHPALADAVAYARERGALVVAAAGNDYPRDQRPRYPAAYPGVVGVAATDAAGTRVSSFTGRGSWVDLAAPGERVLSTTPGGAYARFSGTSFAAPFVSAAAALVLARHPDFDGDDLALRLSRSARPIDAGVAWGFVDAARAVTERPGGVVLGGAAGGVYAFGDAVFRGSAAATPLQRPIVGIATGGNRGYWLVASDGGVFAFGGIGFHGSTGAMTLNRPIVGMAATPSGNGYWLVASDGGIFSFGDAAFRGSTGAMTLNRPIVGMAATPSGNGYWLVASDGGIFTFGDARFAGSTGAITLVSPIVGMAAPTAGSYWLAAADGGVFAFDAPFLGSAAGRLPSPAVGIATGPGGAGYWLATRDGRVLPFGEVADDGSVHPPPSAPVVGIASTGS